VVAAANSSEGGPAAAARAADANIPIVFIVGPDPVQLGFVASFSRPGGKMTGIYTINSELVGKMLSLLASIIRPPRGQFSGVVQGARSHCAAIDIATRRRGGRITFRTSRFTEPRAQAFASSRNLNPSAAAAHHWCPEWVNRRHRTFATGTAEFASIADANEADCLRQADEGSAASARRQVLPNNRPPRRARRGATSTAAGGWLHF
jgi:hypothetical protein